MCVNVCVCQLVAVACFSRSLATSLIGSQKTRPRGMLINDQTRRRRCSTATTMSSKWAMWLCVCQCVCVSLPHQASLLFVACYKFCFCFCLTAKYAARRTFCIHMLNIYSQAKQSVNYVGVSLSHSHSPPTPLSLSHTPLLFVSLSPWLMHI